MNPVMQRGMKMSRNGDVITISCDVTGPRVDDQQLIWQMTCVRNQWIGSYGNCSTASTSRAVVN